MRYKIGNREFEAESRYLTLNLMDSTQIRDDPATLHARNGGAVAGRVQRFILPLLAT